MIFVSKIFLSAFLLLIAGLLMKKAFHPEYNVTQATKALKSDIRNVFKALVEKEQIRHTFDNTLSDDINTITKPYSNIGFEIYIRRNELRGCPAISVSFVPNHTLEDLELQELSRLLVIKFKEYTAYYKSNWQVFAMYTVGSDYVNIYIVYSEFKSDIESFTNLYRYNVRQKTTTLGGILRDPELEAELKNVN